MSFTFQVCEDKEIKVPRVICEDPEKKAEDAETI